MQADQRAVVRFDGEIDMATSPRFEQALLEAAATGAGEIVVDLAGVRFMDSSGLRLLTKARAALEREGRRLVVRGARRSVRRVFELTGSEYLLAA